MWSHELSRLSAPLAGHRARQVLALALLTGSRLLGLLAQRVAACPPGADVEPIVEFHGEAGAPEGALYVNGQLVGRVLGANRL